MKLSANLLAFSALSASASAFSMQMSSPLYSSPSGMSGVGTDRAGGPAGQMSAPPAGQLKSPPAPGGARTPDMKLTKNIWDTLAPITVQGGSLKTWSFTTPAVERVQVLLKTEGRPLNTNIDLWQGPDNTPQKMRVYIEDGNTRPFSAVVETPGGQNSVAIRNTGAMEFPLAACVEADEADGLLSISDKLAASVPPQTIQGGSLKTYSFDPYVSSVQILLKTDGRPLNARIELLQGPNNNKQVIELYTEDGLARPFYAVIETPGTGNVVRVLNTAPVEFPMNARVEPFLVENGKQDSVVVSDGAGAFGGSGWDSSAPF